MLSWKFVALKILRSDGGSDPLKQKIFVPALSFSSEEEQNNETSSRNSPISFEQEKILKSSNNHLYLQ